jgi:hypothetical protein
MDIPYKIKDILLANTLITNIIGNKVFPILATQGTDPPAILYEFEESKPMQTPTCKIRNATIALHCFSTSYDQAKVLSDLMEGILNTFHDNEIHFCMLESKKDIPENGEEGNGQLYHVELIFNIQSI